MHCDDAACSCAGVADAEKGANKEEISDREFDVSSDHVVTIHVDNWSDQLVRQQAELLPLHLIAIKEIIARVIFGGKNKCPRLRLQVDHRFVLWTTGFLG